MTRQTSSNTYIQQVLDAEYEAEEILNDAKESKNNYMFACMHTCSHITHTHLLTHIVRTHIVVNMLCSERIQKLKEAIKLSEEEAQAFQTEQHNLLESTLKQVLPYTCLYHTSSDIRVVHNICLTV